MRVFLLSSWYSSRIITEFLSHVALLFTVNFLAVIIIIIQKHFYNRSVSPRPSLRSLDARGLFLALVVCGDGHCWRHLHGCAHGCLCGKAAAQGDALRVRKAAVPPRGQN